MSVAICHFSLLFLITDQVSWVESLKYGEHGVDLFFIISGFIIPYSLWSSPYSLKQFFNYLKRRFLRICPPSYIAIMLGIIFYYSIPFFFNRNLEGVQAPDLSPGSILSNLFYVVPFTGYEWYNPVYWTLSIEFQFYILIGLIFPILRSRQPFLVYGILLTLLGLSFIEFNTFFRYACYFVIGINLFLYRIRIVQHAVISYLLSFLSIAVCMYLFGIVSAFIILFAEIVIRSEVRLTNPILHLLGKISFSMYITHTTIGILFEVITRRMFGEVFNTHQILALLGFYLFMVITSSWIFYKLFEAPFFKLSKRLKYRVTD